MSDKYLLDLTGIDSSHPLCGLKVQCKKGRFLKDFDIDECDIPRHIFNSKRSKNPGAYKIPIGFNYINVMRCEGKLIKIIDKKTIMQRIVDFIRIKK